MTPAKDAGGNFVFFVYDKETGKVYHRTVAGWDMPDAGVTAEQILKKQN